MKITRLGWAELLGLGAAAVLFVSLFLPWFSTDPTNRNSRVAGLRSSQETITAFVAFDSFQYMLIAASLAPVVLAYIVMRGHSVSWDRGEITAIVGITALVLILYNGLIGGKPDDAVSTTFGVGYYVAIVASIGIFVAGVMRLAEHGPENKPPGV
jgi:hypothetical protein